MGTIILAYSTVGLAIPALKRYLVPMLELLEMALRWILGTQLFFWGLNGFFQWKKVPPSSEIINQFTELCIQSKFIMPTVKTVEIVGGVLLVLNLATPLALVTLAPLIFVITGLHLFHNKRWWEVIVPLSLPFITLMALHYESWQKLALI